MSAGLILWSAPLPYDNHPAPSSHLQVGSKLKAETREQIECSLTSVSLGHLDVVCCYSSRNTDRFLYNTRAHSPIVLLSPSVSLTSLVPGFLSGTFETSGSCRILVRGRPWHLLLVHDERDALLRPTLRIMSYRPSRSLLVQNSSIGLSFRVVASANHDTDCLGL